MITIKPKPPIERYEIRGVEVFVRREDLRPNKPLPPHGKMSVLAMLCKKAKADGYKMIGCFGSKPSNWVAGLPLLASSHGLKSIVCYPSKRFTDCPPWLVNTFKHFHSMVEEKTGAQLHLLKPNMTSINSAQAKKRIESRGGWFIPFGLETDCTIDYLSHHFSHINFNLYGTLVVSCGSGVTLTCLIKAMHMTNSYPNKIVAVSSGRSTTKIMLTVLRHTALPKIIKWVDSYDYNDIPDIQCPWNAHDHYELKAYDWMFKHINRLPMPIYFVNVGGNSNDRA